MEIKRPNTPPWRRAARRRRLEDHPEGQPFSASTYTNWICRCPQCRAAETTRQRDYYQRAHRARQV